MSPLTRRDFLRVSGGSIAAASLFAACGSSKSTPAATKTSSATKGGEIGLILNGLVAYTQNQASGIAHALEGTKYSLFALQSNFTDATVVANFETMISRKVAGILVLPNTPESMDEGVTAAHNAGIPVVDLGWESATSVDSLLVGRVYTDETELARKIASYIGSTHKPTQVVLVSGEAGNPGSDTFQAGFAKAVAALGAGWSLAGVEPGDYSRTGAITAAQNLLTAHPDAGVIVSFAAVMGDGIASYLKQRDKKITNICTDGDLEMVSWMKQGWIQADGYYSAARQGILGTDALLAYLKTGKVQTGLLSTPIQMVPASKIDEAMAADPLTYPKFDDIHIG